jgi:hypothetical protein
MTAIWRENLLLAGEGAEFARGIVSAAVWRSQRLFWINFMVKIGKADPRNGSSLSGFRSFPCQLPLRMLCTVHQARSYEIGEPPAQTTSSGRKHGLIHLLGSAFPRSWCGKSTITQNSTHVCGDRVDVMGFDLGIY